MRSRFWMGRRHALPNWICFAGAVCAESRRKVALWSTRAGVIQSKHVYLLFMLRKYCEREQHGWLRSSASECRRSWSLQWITNPLSNRGLDSLPRRGYGCHDDHTSEDTPKTSGMPTVEQHMRAFMLTLWYSGFVCLIKKRHNDEYRQKPPGRLSSTF